MSFYFNAMILFGFLVGTIFCLMKTCMTRSTHLDPIDYSETNVRLWCATLGYDLQSLRRRGQSAPRVGFRFQVEDLDGSRRSGLVVADRDRVDPQSRRLSVAWDRVDPAMAVARSIEDDPLWDDGLDGGPRA